MFAQLSLFATSLSTQLITAQLFRPFCLLAFLLNSSFWPDETPIFSRVPMHLDPLKKGFKTSTFALQKSNFFSSPEGPWQGPGYSIYHRGPPLKNVKFWLSPQKWPKILKIWAGLPRYLKKTGKLGHFRCEWRKKIGHRFPWNMHLLTGNNPQRRGCVLVVITVH